MNESNTDKYFRGQKEYWQKRCNLAERCIGDPQQIKEWAQFIKEFPNDIP